MKSHVCRLPDGSDGLCCKARTATKAGLVNPIRNLAMRNKDFSMQDRQKLNSFYAFQIRKAAEIGQSFAENITRIRRKTLDKTRFSSYLHAKNQKINNPGIYEMMKSSLAFTGATKNLMSDRRMSNHDLRNLNFVDFRNSVLDGVCKTNDEFDCTSASISKYRTIDGSCNNLRVPKVGIKSRDQFQNFILHDVL